MKGKKILELIKNSIKKTKKSTDLSETVEFEEDVFNMNENETKKNKNGKHLGKNVRVVTIPTPSTSNYRSNKVVPELPFST